MVEPLTGLIVLRHLWVENANAISGPLTWGFPAITAFTGFAHALRLKMADADVRFDGVGVVCHRFLPQVAPGRGKNPGRFCLPRHPLACKNGEAVSAPLIEEGRAHLDVSLLLGLRGGIDEERGGPDLAQKVLHTALGMRLAGGAIRPAPPGRQNEASYEALGGDAVSRQNVFRGLRRKLLPGFTLLDRSSLLLAHLAHKRQERPEATSLDALLDLSRLKVAPIVSETDTGQDQPDETTKTKVEWRASRVRPGWLVPIPVGFGAISPLYPPGAVKNARDMETPFRFVETIYSLGEWVSPHRIDDPHGLMWIHQAKPDDGLYLCQQMETVS